MKNPHRWFANGLVLVSLLACNPKKNEPEYPRTVAMETPDPVSPEDRTSAAALRETDKDPRDKSKTAKKSPKVTDYDDGESGEKPVATTANTPPGKTPPKEEAPPKPAHPGVLAKVSSAKPLPKETTLGDLGLQIMFLNVGQADSILVIGPKGTLLIDAGEETQKQSQSKNYLKIKDKLYELTGRNHLDYFVPSHYHVDHDGSARSGNGIWGLIDEGVTIGAIVDRGDFFLGATRPGGWKTYPESIQGWIDSGIVGKRVTAQVGTGQIDLGEGVTVEVIAVNSNGVLQKKEQQNIGYFDKCPPSENDYSVALKISVGNFEFYTAGDLSGEDVERKFGKDCQSYNDVETYIAPKIGDVELYKVTHHGSEHSNNELLLNTIDPEVAVIMSGGGYNHPAQDVAKRLIETCLTLDTGGFSAKEWPSGPPPEIGVVGDVLVQVGAGGGKYMVKYASTVTTFRSYSDAEEAKELDQKNAPIGK
jgi:beta-lactamase superfamily II metal-dependent hydrolase